MEAQKKVLLEEEELHRVIQRMAHEIVEKTDGAGGLALIGIRTRGAYLVRRIAKRIEALTGSSVAMGIIDVTAYRDDVTREKSSPAPDAVEVPVSCDDKNVVLIDDVIYTGRTVRAALDLIPHLGKPGRIFVAILVDRGERELPIKADIVGKNVQVGEGERVNVLLRELDGIDRVVVTGSRELPSNPRG